MNGAHWHLIVNHVSLFLIPIGAVALAVAMKRKSAELRVFAAALFLVAGVFGYIADDTGGDAAFVLRSVVDESVRPFIRQHAQAAEFAEGTGFLVAALAIAMELAARKKEKWLLPIQWVLLLAAIHSSTVYARTAYLGGLIRHTEIRAGN